MVVYSIVKIIEDKIAVYDATKIAFRDAVNCKQYNNIFKELLQKSCNTF